MEGDTHLHLVNVERCDNLWECEVLGDGPGHPDLVDPQVGVGRDDGSGGKVDTFSHKISSDSSLLALSASNSFSDSLSPNECQSWWLKSDLS